MISSSTGSMIADITEAVQLSTALAIVPASVVVVVAVTDKVNVVVTVSTNEARGVVVIVDVLILSLLLWYDD